MDSVDLTLNFDVYKSDTNYIKYAETNLQTKLYAKSFLSLRFFFGVFTARVKNYLFAVV